MVRNILCIDKDMAAVQECLNGLKGLEPDITTDFCSSLSEGRNLFREQYYGLIIIDLSVLNRHILEFVEEVRRGNFYGDLIFTGNYQDPETLKKIGMLKDVEILLKPFDIQWFISRIRKYFEEKVSIGNRINSIGPCFYMRLMNLGDCTGSCRISKDDRQGIIYFENGEIINAKSWRNTGELALVDLLDLRDAEVEIISGAGGGAKKINMDFNDLISIVSSRSSGGCIEKIGGTDPEGEGFIRHLIKELNTVKGLDGELLVNNAAALLGHSVFGYPEDAEVDLIERLAGEIKDKSELVKFKKKMMIFLKDREMGKIKKEG